MKGDGVEGWFAKHLVNFLMAFVPIFFAVDALGVLPLFMGLTEGMDRADRQRVLKQSLVTAFLVAAGFVFLGKSIFHLMGITVEDFMVAGGALLFIIAALDLVTETKYTLRVPTTIGAVPLGTPLIIGPATLTMALILVDVYGVVETMLAIVANIALAGVVFSLADVLTRLLGAAGSRALSKVAGLILAAIAVMMIRRGLPAVFAFMAAKQS
jgi:multiple antibiotic resistance protein